MKTNLHRQAGQLFILGSLLLFIPYITLIYIFDYPDILRMPVDHILTSFHDGGTLLILVWWVFSLAGLPLLWAAIFLRKIIGEEYQNVKVATTFMIIGGITQIVGLLRWVFVVPVLSNYYAEHPDTSQETVSILFQVVHQYGGVILGEHLGQLFSIIWTLIVCHHFLKSKTLNPFIGWFGIISSLIYLLGQTELFATVIPTFPVIGWAAPIGSTLWLLWMIALGFTLIRKK
ncbi:DUF4386 domain-containing protein [Paenibacillus wynnii]|uniref:DUF4386 domain-containing protein n=1 Tax=Paenibacillus wynnii TaxID=268407 RepID=UPI00278ED263|nr:DUF4386 domain-containing protein [Paenibacillus wynnii]MDQ0194168.1 hypothetical protein [Paenibacillus wynnii]